MAENRTVKNKVEEVEKNELTDTVPIPMPKKPLTAYFHFLKENRDVFKAKFPDLGIGPLQKELGAYWKELPETERERYAALAAEDKLRYEREKAVLVENGQWINPKAAKETSTTEAPIPLPLARVRQIIVSDPDVKKVTKEAVQAIGKATELFIRSLSKSTLEKTSTTKRKTITPNDLSSAIYSKAAFKFLREDFAKPETEQTTTQKIKRKKTDTKLANGNSITKFLA